jgi:hypothetical protein
MGRLTEKDAYWLGEEFWTSAREPDDEEIDAVYIKLKEYEDLEEQGLLHKAQLKDGTPIYVLQCSWDDDYVVHEEVYLYGMTEYLIGEINKDCWLTKEEAEKALAEMEK